MSASDGMTFESQPEHVKASFYATYGDQAASRWEAEHDAELQQLRTNPGSTPFFQDPSPVQTREPGVADLGALRRALQLANYGGDYWDTQGMLSAFDRAGQGTNPAAAGTVQPQNPGAVFGPVQPVAPTFGPPTAPGQGGFQFPGAPPAPTTGAPINPYLPQTWR